MIRYGKEIVFVSVHGHVGISGNLAADSAAKYALDGDISDEYIFFLWFETGFEQWRHWSLANWVKQLPPKQTAQDQSTNKRIPDILSLHLEIRHGSTQTTYWPFIDDTLFLVERSGSFLLHPM